MRVLNTGAGESADPSKLSWHIHLLCFALQGGASSSTSAFPKPGGTFKVPYPKPGSGKKKPGAGAAKQSQQPQKPKKGGHVQDAAQTRRDWQRADVLISRLRAEIARLEAELFKRDVQLEAGQWMYQQSLAHQASLQVMRDEIRSCEAKQTESDKRLELLQATTASRSQEQEKALLVALQQHKKLQDETEQKRVQGMATLETRLSEWTRYAMERDKELGKTQEQLRLATEANERAKKHKDGPS